MMQDVRAIAVGVLQMSVDDANRLSVADITRALAWHRYERKMERRENWNIDRLMTYILTQPYDPKNKIKTPDMLFKFPWEEEDKPELTPEQISAIIKRMDDNHRKKHGKQ